MRDIKIPEVSPLACEFRGDLLDMVRYGHFAVTDESGKIVWGAGDVNAEASYRSSAKPIQALPTLVYGLDEKYGLTQEETAILAASHQGESFHIKVLESILEKTGLSEDDLIVNPTAPEDCRDYNGIPRKLNNTCSCKHLALMLLQRHLTGAVEGYHLPDSPAQQEVLQTVATLSGCDVKNIGLAIDGCGVPVFSVKVHEMADAFLRLACPELIGDEKLRTAAEKISAAMCAYPHIIRGSGSTCLAMNSDSNIIAKSGANGLYCFALKKERLGVAVKLIDTAGGWISFMVRKILEGIGYDNKAVLDELYKLMGDEVYNGCGDVVGHREFLHEFQGAFD